MAGVTRTGTEERRSTRGSADLRAIRPESGHSRMSARPGVRRIRLRAGGAEYARECLSRLARILVHGGHSPKRLSRDFRDICSELKEPTRPWDPTRLTFYADLPHVIAHWHSDPRYMDSRGRPVPLPLRGRGPCLSALIARVLPGEAPVSVAESLVRSNSVRRRKGLYTPTKRSLVYPKAAARVHGMNAFLGMLRTVDHNVAGKGPRLYERAAMNPSIPVSALPAFYKWAERFGDRFLEGADSFLQNREAEEKGGLRVRVGVDVCVFAGPADSRVRPRRKPLRTGRVPRRQKRWGGGA
jgi:hypothetical protein